MSDLFQFVTNIAVGLTLSFCVLLVGYGRDRQLLVWSGAFALHAVSYALIGARGYIPDFISIVIANTLLASMLALYLEGILRFQNVRSKYWAYWLPVLMTFCAYWYFIDNFDMRVIVGSVIYASQALLLVFFVFRGLKVLEGRGKWIILVAVLIGTLMLIFRAIATKTSDEVVSSLGGSSLLPMVTSTSAMVVMIMFAFGLIVIFKERAEQETLALAQLDPLTKLGNRRMLDDSLRQARHKSARDKQIAAIIMLDLDDFKTLNDTYGHSLGDQLLLEAAYRLKECVKSSDTVVRLGGDEFVVLLCDLGLDSRIARESATNVATRILTELAQPYKFLSIAIEGKEQSAIQHRCTCSLGMTFFTGSNQSGHHDLENADAAMYKAKEQGRNRMVIYEA
jgi:diguanylate cyclase (GGDEF)-like protein